MSKKVLYVNVDGDYEESLGVFEEADHVAASTGVAQAGAPIVLDAAGLIDPSMINFGSIDHGALSGLADDDHTQYILVDGTRAFSADQSMGGNRLTSVANPTAAQDATTKAYVDAVAVGLRPHGNCAVATTGNIDVASAPAAIDGFTMSSGDRVLVKDQTDATENGIYDFNGAGSALTRSADQDNSPLGEIYNGVFIPMILNGTVNVDKPFVITSVGTGTDGLHIIGTDDIIFDVFTSPTQLQGGNGIDISSNIISVDIVTAAGLKFVGDQLAVEPADFAGSGLVDDGADNLAVDWSTSFDEANKAIQAIHLASVTNGEGASIIGIEDSASYFTGADVEAATSEVASQLGGTTSTTFDFSENNVLADNDSVYPALEKLDLKFGDLASIANGEGASLVGIEDANSNYDATTVEGALDEIATKLVDRDTATAGATIAVGDLLYFSAADTVSPMPISSNNKAVGVALEAATSGNEVAYARWDEVAFSCLSGATAGTRYYWDGSSLTTTIPSGAGYVWQAGIAKNATDLLATVEFIKKNTP